MSFEDEDIPDIDLPDIDILQEPDEDEDEELEIEDLLKKIQNYMKKHRLTTPKNLLKRKNKKILELKQLIKDIDLIILSETYKKQMTYIEYVRKHDRLRRNLLKSLLRGLDHEAKIVALKDLLNEFCGDTEPVDYYIW